MSVDALSSDVKPIRTSTPSVTSLLAALSCLKTDDSHGSWGQASTSTAPDDTAASFTGNGSPLKRLSPESSETARKILLTLHVLFPHELLPALDLLDRRLVVRFTPGSVHGDHAPSEVYYVQSSSSQSTGKQIRKKAVAEAIFYEVRLDSWNCTCPAFTVSAYQRLKTGGGQDEDVDSHPGEQFATDVTHATAHSTSPSPERHGWRFGGTVTRDHVSLPSCKHILATALAKAAPALFESGVVEKIVSNDDLAAWGGGWGELGVA